MRSLDLKSHLPDLFSVRTRIVLESRCKWISPKKIVARPYSQQRIDTSERMSRQPKEQVRAALTKDGGDRSIAQRLRNRKALDLLIDNAQVTEEEWTDEQQSENE